MKPIVSSFMFFDEIQHIGNAGAPGNSLHLINPQSTIRTPFIPNTYSFAVAFGVSGIDSTIDHTLTFRLLNPDNEAVVDTSEINIVGVPTNPQNIPVEAQGHNFNLNLRNIHLTKEGKFLGQVYINKELIGEFPLFVYLNNR